MLITNAVLKDYFHCKLKAYYKSINLNISNKPFYYFEQYLKDRTKKLFIKSNKIKPFNTLLPMQAGCIYSIQDTLKFSTTH